MAYARRHRRDGVQQHMAYDHLEIEAGWQRYWDKHGTFRATRRSGESKRYVLDAIETGQHPAETTANNIATFKRQLKMLAFRLPVNWCPAL